MEDSERTAVITGASSGIGEAMARRFALAGWRVALAARRVERLLGLQRIELSFGWLEDAIDPALPRRKSD